MKNKLFLSMLTKAINFYLKMDAMSSQRLAKLQGNIITIELLPLHIIFQCTFDLQGILLKTDTFADSHAYIKGTPLQMAGMLINKQDRQRFFMDDLIIEGDAELGQQVVSLFDELHIDREAYLAQLLGDVPGYHANQLIHNVSNWLRQSHENVLQNINEYCHEEAAWFPSREALNDFFCEIDTLRMDADRIEAKIQLLTRQIQESAISHVGNTKDEVP